MVTGDGKYLERKRKKERIVSVNIAVAKFKINIATIIIVDYYIDIE